MPEVAVRFYLTHILVAIVAFLWDSPNQKKESVHLLIKLFDFKLFDFKLKHTQLSKH